MTRDPRKDTQPGAVRPIRVAYADPPYLGMAARYSVPGTPEHHPDAARWDSLEEHAALLRRLDREFPDGWAYSLSAPTLRPLLAVAPEGARVAAWVKPFVSTMGVCRVAKQGAVWSWEPVIYRLGDRLPVTLERDWVSASTGGTFSQPFFGSKPPPFSQWLFRLFGLGQHPDDEFVDLFPGSGAVTRAWQEYRGVAITKGGVTQEALFADPPKQARRKRAKAAP